jgi:hypothetical protein
VIKDMIDLQASIYGFCGSETLFNSLSKTFSDEGLTQLASRSVLGVLFDFSDHLFYVRNPEMNSFCRAYHTAKIFNSLFNFGIS